MSDHHGAILRAELLKKGKPFSLIAKELGVSRAWLYQTFEKEKFTAKDIHKLQPYFPYELSSSVLKHKSEGPTTGEPNTEVTYWRNKYYALLEEHIELLRKRG